MINRKLNMILYLHAIASQTIVDLIGNLLNNQPLNILLHSIIYIYIYALIFYCAEYLIFVQNKKKILRNPITLDVYTYMNRNSSKFIPALYISNSKIWREKSQYLNLLAEVSLI